MKGSFKEQCIALRTRGHTLPEIVQLTGRSKTSIYFHIQAIPLTSEKRESIRLARSKSAQVLSSARKGKSARAFKTFEEWTPDLVLLVGHLSFDGEITRQRACYNNRSLVLIERVERLMNLVYGFEPKRYYNNATGVVRTSYNNVALGAFLKQKSEELLNGINEMPLEAQREYIRAFFDDEGCMDFRPKKNKRKVRGYQKNTKVLEVVKNLLSGFAIEAHIKQPNEVVISGKENLLKFQKEINFSPGIRINGNRSNSIWKESLEKRELLQRAIDSFRT